MLEPSEELPFQRPFPPEKIVKQSIIVKNEHPSLALAFKVKTTAPKNYCVRPNAGKLAPNSKCEVQVLLQAASKDEDAAAVAQRKDKFLIQGIRIPNDLMVAQEGEDAQARLAELWTQAEQVKKVDPTIVFEKKIRCVFVNEDNAAAAATPAASTVTAVSSSSSSTSANSSLAAVSAAASTTSTTTASQPKTLTTSSATISSVAPPPSSSLVDSVVSSSSTLASTSPSLKANSISSPIPPQTTLLPPPHVNLGAGINASITSSSSSTSSVAALDDLENELTSARENVKRLTAACEGYRAEIDRLNALRQRKAASAVANGLSSSNSNISNGTSSNLIGALSGSNGDLSASTLLQLSQQGGVPLQTVGLLVAAAFLLGAIIF